MDSFFCEYNLGQAMEISYNVYKEFSDNTNYRGENYKCRRFR